MCANFMLFIIIITVLCYVSHIECMGICAIQVRPFWLTDRFAQYKLDHSG